MAALVMTVRERKRFPPAAVRVPYHEDNMQWREVVGKHHTALIDELTASWDSELSATRRSHAEALNLSLRRFRQASDEGQVLDLLRESCVPCAQQAVVLVFENHQVPVARFGKVSFELAAAHAVISAIESRDLIVTIASDRQLSPSLAQALRGEDSDVDDKAYLFPVVARQAVVAMVAASGDVNAAQIELFCEAAAMRLEALAPVATAAVSASDKNAWDNLSAEDQKLHLQAQRMARVRVAEMRLYHEEALRKGTDACDVYRALKPHIDAARHQFLQTYLSKSPTMVDYLHLEILRSLVNDEDALLGTSYPGPMV